MIDLIASAAAAPVVDVEAATRAYLDTLQGAARAKSDAYFEGGYWLLLWNALIGIGSAWLLLRFGWSARFRDWAERVTQRRRLQPVLYGLPYLLASALIVLPWSIYTGFFRERHYDFMNLSFGAWLGEQAIALVIQTIVFALFLGVLFALIRRAPRLWWLFGTGAVALFLAIGIMIAPLFIAPLFNDYRPMPAGPLRDSIIAMARANDVPADDVFVFDQSKQHKRISANVSGLGETRRISLNDNLLERSDAAEVKAVMGHELGHYVLGHVGRLLLLFTLIVGVGLFLVAAVSPRILARHGERWRVRGVDDPAATPLFAMILTAYLFAMTPVTNSIIRVNESEADLFGLNAAREPDGFARIAMKLSEYRKIEPGPVEEMLFFDHPSGATRVRMAMQWKADHLAKQPRE